MTERSTTLRAVVLSKTVVRSGPLRIVGLITLTLAIGASILGLAFFRNPDQGRIAWQFHFASIVLFLVAGYLLFPVKIEGPRWSSTFVVAACAILGIAVFMRLYRFDVLPFGTWFDEADNGLTVINILSNPEYRPVFVQSTNLPAHFLYLIGFAFQLFGANTMSIRAVTAAFGIGSVVAGFFVGREAHGNRFGLILAFLVAVSHWNINFSRIGLHGISTPFFILFTLLFLLRARRTGHVLDYAWAGIGFGFGLCFYAAFRAFGIVIAVFIIYIIVGWWRSKDRSVESLALATSLAAFAIGAGLIIAPVAQFAIGDPEGFWNRTNETSIFFHRDEPNLGRAILSNTFKHLLMFNFSGDNNGRHNLPGEPMLDPVTGALFLLGLALVISQPNDLARMLVLISFAAGLSGGIFTVDYEAPQSLRSIGSMPAAFYFAALAAETLWRALDRIELTTVIRRLLNVILAFGVGGYILYSNFSTYFVRQANDDAVWASYNGIESTIARRMISLGPDKTTFYVSMYYYNHNVIRFLAPLVTDSRTIIPPDVLPVRESGDKPVVMFIDYANNWIVDDVSRYYPNAQIITDHTPLGNPSVYTIIIPPDDIRNIQGLTARYWRADSTDGDPIFARTEKTLDTMWPDNAPVAPPFVAEWSGVLYVPDYGDYDILLRAPASAELWLDEASVLDGSGEQQTTLTLAKGNHVLRVRAASGGGAVQLLWRRLIAGTEPPFVIIPPTSLYLSPPTTVHGLRATFYSGDGWQPPARLARVDPFLDMYFHILPIPRPYTADWAGQIEIPADGDYVFGIKVKGHAKLFIDDQLVVDAPEPTEYIEGRITLTSGHHRLLVKFLDDIGGSELRLYWTRPDGEREIVPSDVLLPYP